MPALKTLKIDFSIPSKENYAVYGIVSPSLAIHQLAHIVCKELNLDLQREKPEYQEQFALFKKHLEEEHIYAFLLENNNGSTKLIQKSDFDAFLIFIGECAAKDTDALSRKMENNPNIFSIHPIPNNKLLYSELRDFYQEYEYLY